jgi:hypothetical protein
VTTFLDAPAAAAFIRGDLEHLGSMFDHGDDGSLRSTVEWSSSSVPTLDRSRRPYA